MSAIADRQAAPTSGRLALAARVAELRADGLVYRDIAETLEISRSYAATLGTDPDGSKQLARRARYQGTCERCGGGTDGSNGREGAPTHCATCAPDAYRMWTRETIIDAICRWAEKNGRPPTASDWNGAARPRGFPATSNVFRHAGNPGGVFASWADAIEAAGFSRPRVGKREGQRDWSLERLLEELRAHASDGFVSSASDHGFHTIAVRYFGSWAAACAAAGVRPASERRARAPEAVPTRKGTGS